MAKGTKKSERAQKIEPVSLGELIHTQDPAPRDALRGGGRAGMDLGTPAALPAVGAGGQRSGGRHLPGRRQHAADPAGPAPGPLAFAPSPAPFQAWKAALSAQNGDQIDLETDGLGRLRLKMGDELKRTWAGETLLVRQENTLEGTTPQLTGKYAPVR